MPAGRKPKPTNLKVINGTNRVDRVNKKEPKVAPNIPKPPSHINKDGLKEWHRVCKEMVSAGIISNLDRAGLAAYCQAYGRWVEAEDTLLIMAKKDKTTRGLMIKTKTGNLIQNPMVGTANKAMADMMKYAAEFGMTPSARSRITSLGSEEDHDPFSAFS